MSKGGKGKAKGKSTQSRQTSRSARAGISFPVGRIATMLKKGGYAERVGSGAPVYMATVLEYLVAEILELAGNAAKACKKTRIAPKHISTAILGDAELSKVCQSAVFA